MSSDRIDDRGRSDGVVDWTELGQRMWSFLTGREAAINYRFDDFEVEVPRDTGTESPRAVWKRNGHAAVDHRRQTGPISS